MQIHALEVTGGFVYSEMGQYLAKPGTPKSQLTPDGATSNTQYAQLDPKTKQPVANGARNVWVTETALTTALNTSYMASQLALFGIVVGIALPLSGFGFAILALGGALRRPESRQDVVVDKPTPKSGTVPAWCERTVGLRTGADRVVALLRTDGDIGRVQGLVVDPADHHVTHVLLDEGHLWGKKEVAIPIGAVTGVEDGVRLNLTKDELSALPPVEIDRA